MSLINVSLSPSKAIIGVDTECIDYRTGRLIAVNKIFHLSHANVVMTGRGIHGFHLVLFSMISQLNILGKGGDDFDSIADAMPETFESAYRTLSSHLPDGVNDLSVFDEQQVVLVGWSNLQNRMRAVCYSKSGPSAGIEVIEIEEPGYMMPWCDGWGEPPEADGHSGMIKLALAQTEFTKKESPGTAMGGRLLIAELTRYGMAFSQSCELPASQGHGAASIVFTAEELQMAIAGSANADLAERLQMPRAMSNESGKV